MQKVKLNVYQLAHWVFELKDLLSTKPEIIELNKMINEDINKSVFNPDITTYGLYKRQTSITNVGITMGMIGFLLLFFTIVPIMLLSGPFIIAQFLYIIMFYFIGSGIYICIVRGNKARCDEIRFKEEGFPDSFTLDIQAYIRWYDFLSGIPLGLMTLSW